MMEERRGDWVRNEEREGERDPEEKEKNTRCQANLDERRREARGGEGGGDGVDV